MLHLNYRVFFKGLSWIKVQKHDNPTALADGPRRLRRQQHGSPLAQQQAQQQAAISLLLQVRAPSTWFHAAVGGRCYKALLLITLPGSSSCRMSSHTA